MHTCHKNPPPSIQGLESAGNQISSHAVNRFGPKGFAFATRSDIYQQKQTDGPQKSLLASRLTYQQYDVYEMETLPGLTSTETLVLGRSWFGGTIRGARREKLHNHTSDAKLLNVQLFYSQFPHFENHSAPCNLSITVTM